MKFMLLVNLPCEWELQQGNRSVIYSQWKLLYGWKSFNFQLHRDQKSHLISTIKPASRQGRLFRLGIFTPFGNAHNLHTFQNCSQQVLATELAHSPAALTLSAVALLRIISWTLL